MLGLYEILPLEFIQYPVVYHSISFILTGFLFLAFIAIGYQLWLFHLQIFCTNKTTKERSNRKKQSRVESIADGKSTTTSLQAEKVVENIGKRREATGCARWCKNFAGFCAASFEADCCMKDDQVGYQEKITKELYLNMKERHAFEDDWGMVIHNVNSEIENENQNEQKDAAPKVRKARHNTLNDKYEIESSRLKKAVSMRN